MVCSIINKIFFYWKEWAVLPDLGQIRVIFTRNELLVLSLKSHTFHKQRPSFPFQQPGKHRGPFECRNAFFLLFRKLICTLFKGECHFGIKTKAAPFHLPCDASVVQVLEVHRLFLSWYVSFAAWGQLFLSSNRWSLECLQAVVVVSDHVLTGEGIVVLCFMCVLGLEHLLLDLNNLACSYLWRQKSMKAFSEGRLKRKINPGTLAARMELIGIINKC